MAIKIFNTTYENFPEKVAVCGHGILDAGFVLNARKSRTEWVYNKLRKGIVVNTAIDCGEVVGQISALPLNESPIELTGDGYYYIPCIWMAPKCASPALGEELLSSVVAQLNRGFVGLVTLSDELWMNHRSFLERFGFAKMGELERVQRVADIMVLPFKTPFKVPEPIPARIPKGFFPRLDFFFSPHCPAHSFIDYRLSKEHSLIADKIAFVKHDAGDRKTVVHYGRSFALLLDGHTDVLRDYLREIPLEIILKEHFKAANAKKELELDRV